MNYELAKELKDAGFKMPTIGTNVAWEDNDEKGIYKAPTLSELIEACGEDFGALLKDGKEYLAYEGSSIDFNPETWDSNIRVGRSHCRNLNTVGSTPEEAVAKLWLELNK